MEKRTSIRMPANLKVRLCLDDENNTGTLMNLSKDGMLINTKVCFPLKSQFEILLHAGEDIIKVPVKVSRLSKRGDSYDGIGVKLMEPSAQYLEFFNNQFSHLKTKMKLKTFICTGCSHIAFEQAPITCPYCNASIDRFYDNSGEVNSVEDFTSIADFEKQHIPVINVEKETTSVNSHNKINIHIKVGEILHKMDVEDRITFIDFYFNDVNLNKKCLARMNLNCHLMHPETTLKFNEKASGRLTVISNCNAHGSWMAETRI